jgi:hypothetical protein
MGGIDPELNSTLLAPPSHDPCRETVVFVVVIIVRPRPRPGPRQPEPVRAGVKQRVHNVHGAAALVPAVHRLQRPQRLARLVVVLWGGGGDDRTEKKRSAVCFAWTLSATRSREIPQFMVISIQEDIYPGRS